MERSKGKWKGKKGNWKGKKGDWKGDWKGKGYASKGDWKGGKKGGKAPHSSGVKCAWFQTKYSGGYNCIYGDKCHDVHEECASFEEYQHCQSLGNVPEHGARLVELATGQHEEDKEQEKETGMRKEARKEKWNQERNHKRQRLPTGQTGTPFVS